jgi:hypothetical protein
LPLAAALAIPPNADAAGNLLGGRRRVDAPPHPPSPGLLAGARRRHRRVGARVVALQRRADIGFNLLLQLAFFAHLGRHLRAGFDRHRSQQRHLRCMRGARGSQRRHRSELNLDES